MSSFTGSSIFWTALFGNNALSPSEYNNYSTRVPYDCNCVLNRAHGGSTPPMFSHLADYFRISGSRACELLGGIVEVFMELKRIGSL